MHDFETENEKGMAGEQELYCLYPYLKDDSCIGWDRIDTRTNKTVEIKTDYWSMKNTQNFFMERYSNNISYKPGGPYRALIYGTDIFLYQFIKNKKIFWFDDVVELIRALDMYVIRYNPKLSPVKNNNYITLGYKIPREVLAHLYIELNYGDELPCY